MTVKQIDTNLKLSDFSVINSDFTRARCRMFHTGRNRNCTDITENALNKLIARKGYANVPVVAHLYKSEDGKWRVGGHDSRIVLKTDGGVEIIDETVPFGVIPEDCNPAVEDVTEKSGEIKKYFCVDIILWTHRYNIMDAASTNEIYFNQSMEITYGSAEYAKDGYTIIDDFQLSALCLLNHDPYNKDNEVKPCFPSAVVKKYNLNGTFNILANKIKEFNFPKEDNCLDISKIKDKLNDNYFALNVTPDSVIAMSKENFEIFEIPFKVDSEKNEVSFGYDKAVRKFMSVSDIDAGISHETISKYVTDYTAAMIDSAKKTVYEKAEAEKAAAVKELTEKFNKVSEDYKALAAEYEKAKERVNTYVKAEKEAAENAHKAEIDNVIESYSAQLYNNADYLLYKTKVDYSKTKEEVENDMLIITGKAAKFGKHRNFSLTEYDSGMINGGSDTAGGKYSSLLERAAHH